MSLIFSQQNNNKIIIGLVVANSVIVILLSGCSTDKLCYQHPHEGDVSILFDWNMSADAQSYVNEMRVLLYSMNGEKAYTKDLPPTGAHCYDIMEGDYSVIAHNHSGGNLKFKYDERYDSYSAYSVDADLLSGMPGRTSTSGLKTATGEPVRYPIDRLWIASSDLEHSKDGGEIILKILPLFCHYTYEIRDIEGSFAHIANASASLSGMAHLITLKDRTLTNETSTLPLEAIIDSKNKLIFGEFYTFGHNEEVSSPHLIEVYLQMDDGKGYKYSGSENLNVTSQIHSAPNPRDVHLVVQGLKIPTVISNGNGFDVGLDEWDNEWIQINL